MSDRTQTSLTGPPNAEYHVNCPLLSRGKANFRILHAGATGWPQYFAYLPIYIHPDSVLLLRPILFVLWCFPINLQVLLTALCTCGTTRNALESARNTPESSRNYACVMGPKLLITGQASSLAGYLNDMRLMSGILVLPTSCKQHLLLVDMIGTASELLDPESNNPLLPARLTTTLGFSFFLASLIICDAIIVRRYNSYTRN